MNTPVRLDMALEQRGLLPSRARARDAILRGTTTVNGVPARKPNQMVRSTDHIVLQDPAAHYVSRAALKLAAGLDAGQIDPANKICLDIGASTGGFTQVLLERGAKHIYAVDVGHGQLHERLKSSSYISSLEGTNARSLTSAEISDPIDLLVSDISFVSVTKVLAAPLALCGPLAKAVILFKPQFEVGRQNISKGGIVTNRAAINIALDGVINFVTAQGFHHRISLLSPISGGNGNQEIVLVFGRK